MMLGLRGGILPPSFGLGSGLLALLPSWLLVGTGPRLIPLHVNISSDAGTKCHHSHHLTLGIHFGIGPLESARVVSDP